MNTLEDVCIYFESKGYLVRAYTYPILEKPVISVSGRRTSGWINGVELHCYKSYWDVINMGNDWVFHRPMDKKHHFANLEGLITVLEDVIGSPIEENHNFKRDNMGHYGMLHLQHPDPHTFLKTQKHIVPNPIHHKRILEFPDLVC